MPTSSEAKWAIARLTVEILYRDFDLAVLEEMLEIGKKSALQFERVPDEVAFLNAALAEEIERRKAIHA